MRNHIRNISLLAAIAAASFTLLIFAFLVIESYRVIEEVGLTKIITDPSWNPVDGYFNLLPMIAGTVLVVLGAILITTPLGLSLAIFSRYYAPKPIAVFYRSLMELLSGIPSVVYGLWGIVVLVPIINSFHPPGTSLVAGILVLSIMILPVFVLVTDAAFSKVPTEHISAGFALGLTKWAVIKAIVLPGSKPGILSGMVLKTGRAIGETMAVLMVCGNIVQVPGSIFEPIRTLTANIALEMAYATNEHRSALFFTGLTLMCIVASLVFISNQRS